MSINADWRALVQNAPEFVLGNFEEAITVPYTPINRPRDDSGERNVKINGASGKATSSALDITEEAGAKERWESGWQEVLPTPPGLYNRGNTCFLNSVLQALMHLPPLVWYLIHQHRSECRQPACILCDMSRHAEACYSSSRPVIPKSILSKIKFIGKQFRIGRQEDAHEFLRHLVDGMQRSLVQRDRKQTVIHRIFEGTLCQQVRCLHCDHISKTFQTMLDLSLDVNRPSILDSLAAFFSPETLTRSNRYRCEKCHKLVEASKHTRIHTPPLVLTLHLKRFAYSLLSTSKITRKIRYPETLDLSAHSSSGAPQKYNLAAVVVHLGNSARSGHYFALCKASNGVWHRFDDDSVSTVKASTALDQQAYMLFYLRESSTSAAAAAYTPAVKSGIESQPLRTEGKANGTPKRERLATFSPIRSPVNSSRDRATSASLSSALAAPTFTERTGANLSSNDWQRRRHRKHIHTYADKRRRQRR